jgi:hypothetical protein
MEALTLALEEPGHAGRIVGRLHELHLRLADPEEGDPDPVLWDVHDRLEIEAEGVAPEPECGVDRPHDERHVVDPAEPADVIGDRVGA